MEMEHVTCRREIRIGRLRGDADSPRPKRLDELYSLIEKIDTAMLTTWEPDG